MTVGAAERRRVRVIASTAENLGIPGGRNLGAAQAVRRGARLSRRRRPLRRARTCWLRAPTPSRRIQRSVSIALRIVDERRSDRPSARSRSRRRQCRSERTGRPRSSAAPSSSAAPRSSGPAATPAEFRYAMEETDLALRLDRRRLDDPLRRHSGRVPPADRSDAPSRRRSTHDAQPGVARLPQPAGAARRRLRRQLVGRLGHPRSRGQLAGRCSGGIGRRLATRPRGQRAPIRWRTSFGSTRLGRPPIV